MTIEEQFADIKTKTPPPPPLGSRAMILMLALTWLRASRRARAN